MAALLLQFVKNEKQTSFDEPSCLGLSDATDNYVTSQHVFSLQKLSFLVLWSALQASVASQISEHCNTDNYLENVEIAKLPVNWHTRMQPLLK